MHRAPCLGTDPRSQSSCEACVYRSRRVCHATSSTGPHNLAGVVHGHIPEGDVAHMVVSDAATQTTRTAMTTRLVSQAVHVQASVAHARSQSVVDATAKHALQLTHLHLTNLPMVRPTPLARTRSTSTLLVFSPSACNNRRHIGLMWPVCQYDSESSLPRLFPRQVNWTCWRHTTRVREMTLMAKVSSWFQTLQSWT